MPTYDFLLLISGVVVAREQGEHKDDAAAHMHGRKLNDLYAVEVWDGERMISRIPKRP